MNNKLERSIETLRSVNPELSAKCMYVVSFMHLAKLYGLDTMPELTEIIEDGACFAILSQCVGKNDLTYGFVNNPDTVKYLSD